MKKTRQSQIYFVNDSDNVYAIRRPHNKDKNGESARNLFIKQGCTERFSLPKEFDPEKHDIWVKVWDDQTIMFSCRDKKLPLFQEQTSWKGYKSRSQAIWSGFWKRMKKEGIIK